MTGAFGYTVAILVAALALRRLPVEVSRWRMRRRSRLLSERSDGGGTTGAPAVPSAGAPHDTRNDPRAGRAPGRLRQEFRRAMDDAAVPADESQAVAVWGAALGVGTLGGLLLAGAPGAAAGAGAGLLGPPVALWSSRRRRARLIVEALPDFLERLARSLRAGVSTATALEEVLPASGPLGAELRRVLGDVRAGSPLPAALDRWRSRCPLAEVNLAAAALSIGASTGGRRAPAVDGVAATLRGMRAAQSEVASLAQQGRLSGLLIALLPLCFLGMSAMLDSGSILALYATPFGMICLVAGGALNLVAFVWMHRITRLP
ncbi:MAG: type II secretion system F family protein [Acidimicrobiia bacterium]|nr:type II secretion system F family protein [Acidimicrobiia bacterium]